MVKYCPTCGSSNPDNSKFCSKCGESIKEMDRRQETQHQSPRRGTSECLWCGRNAGFKEEEGRLDSKWGLTSHKFRFFICNHCGYSHMFAEGRSIFDFD